MSMKVDPSLDHVADEFESLTNLLLDDDVTLDWPRQVLIEIHHYEPEVSRLTSVPKHVLIRISVCACAVDVLQRG
jgi:hypothetical protein